MRVIVESILPCCADLAWVAVQTSALLLEVASPVAVIRPLDGDALPERWAVGQSFRCRSYLFGVIPVGTRTVRVDSIDSADLAIRFSEFDPLCSRWDHLIGIRPMANGRCRYRDEIDFEAGWLTLFVWLFAQAFYRHRQRRWRRVALRLATDGSR